MTPAQQLDGYELIREIGAGGMGTVYEARQLSLDRLVAIKILAEEHEAAPDAVERFRREAKAAAEIDHDNVVRILDFGNTEGGTPYFVMELLSGHNLAQVVRSEGVLAWARVRALALQAAAALEAAHRKGIVHRDIKPANCIVCEDGEGGERLKVCDFGIAKQFGTGAEHQQALTKPGTIVGSTRYMAPEQFTTGQATALSDIYALGIVIHELLVGAPPFRSKNPMEIVTMHVRDAPARVSSLRPELPEAVSDFVLTCLAKQPEDRFESMAALRESLLGLPERAEGPRTMGPGEGTRASSMPPTEILPAEDARASVGFAAAAAPDPDAPIARKVRASTKNFELALEAERKTSGIWVGVVLVLVAAAAAVMVFLS